MCQRKSEFEVLLMLHTARNDESLIDLTKKPKEPNFFHYPAKWDDKIRGSFTLNLTQICPSYISFPQVIGSVRQCLVINDLSISIK